MPFREQSTAILGDRPVSEAPLELNVSTRDVLSAAYQDESFIVNLANDAYDFVFNKPTMDPDYDAALDPRIEQYAGYADNLVHAVSHEDFTNRIQRIDNELAAKATLAEASGLQSIGSAALVAVTDPISWIPIGGPAYRTYRMGGNLLEGAAKTASLAAVLETSREAYMQETQITRTMEQSAMNIASATFLSGLLGGTAAILSPAERAGLEKSIESDLTLPVQPTTQTGRLSSVGAMQTGTTAEQEAIKGLGKTQKVFKYIPDALTNPVYRGSTSESKIVRQFTEQMADTSLIKNKNTEFIASATSIENKIKAYDALKLKFYRDFTPQWQAYRKRVAAQKKAGGIPETERIGSRKDGSLTWREFGEEVTKANRRNDAHIIPEVQTTAQSIRRNMYDPLKQRMVDTGLLDDMDIEIKTADSWVRRMWDRNKILADRQRFKQINLEWLRHKNESALRELDDFKIRNADLIKDKNLEAMAKVEELEQRIISAERSADYLDGVADQIIDRIVGLPGGRLGYDITLEPKSKGPKKVGARGSAKRRVYDIPDEYVEDFLVNDVHAIIESHTRTTAADAEIMDTFGSLDFDVIKQQVKEDYDALIAGAGKDTKRIAGLEKAKRRDIADLQAMWEKLRGIYAQPDDYAAPQHVAERAFLAWNYARLLGGMTVSAIPDMGRHVMVHGMQRTMGDGIAAMITDFKGWKYAIEDIREASIGLDMALSTTARARAHIDEFTPMTGRIDAISQGVAGGFDINGRSFPSFGNITLMNPWNAAQKTFAGIMTQTRMMRAIQDFAKGKEIPIKEKEFLASHGIGKTEAPAIAKMFSKYGESRKRILIPNARKWDDIKSANLFRAAVRKAVDETIVTPGLDRPLWMSRPGWRLVGQFRSFAFASMQRVALSGLQQADGAALGGVMMMIGMGAMTYAVKNLASGHPISDDPRIWLTEGIDRSGITGWFFDVNNIIEKATRGTVGVNALMGGPQMSRYASRNVTDSILGPTLGLSEDFFRLTGAAASRDWKESDTHAMRRLLPYQNVIYLRSLFDQMENGVNNALGVQK